MDGSTQPFSEEDWIHLDSPPVSPTSDMSSLDEIIYEAERLHLMVNPLDLFRPTLKVDTSTAPIFPEAQSTSPEQMSGVPIDRRVSSHYSTVEEMEVDLASGRVAGFDDSPVSERSMDIQTEVNSFADSNALPDEDTVLRDARASVDALFFDSDPTLSNALFFDDPALTDVQDFDPEFTFEFPSNLGSPASSDSAGTGDDHDTPCPPNSREATPPSIPNDVFMGASSGEEIGQTSIRYFSVAPEPEYVRPSDVMQTATDQTQISCDLPELGFTYQPWVDDDSAFPILPAQNQINCDLPDLDFTSMAEAFAFPTQVPYDSFEFSGAPSLVQPADPMASNFTQPSTYGAVGFSSAPIFDVSMKFSGAPVSAALPESHEPSPSRHLHSRYSRYYKQGAERQRRAAARAEEVRESKLAVEQEKQKIIRDRQADERRNEVKARLPGQAPAQQPQYQPPRIVVSPPIPRRVLDDMPVAMPWRIGAELPDLKLPGVFWHQATEVGTINVVGYTTSTPTASRPAGMPMQNQRQPNFRYAPAQQFQHPPTLPKRKRPAESSLNGSSPKKIIIDGVLYQKMRR